MKYIYFGLGNPGEKYEKTRHNAGRILLDAVAKNQDGVLVENIGLKKSIQKTFLLDKNETVFISPMCFMNSSGGFIKRFREEGSMLVVVYDDIDLPFGELRLSYNKSGGSHNGVLSTVKALGTQKFITLRVGVSKVDSFGKVMRVTGAGRVQDFVMADFTGYELKYFNDLAIHAEKIMRLLQTLGLEKTMSVYKS